MLIVLVMCDAGQGRAAHSLQPCGGGVSSCPAAVLWDGWLLPALCVGAHKCTRGCPQVGAWQKIHSCPILKVLWCRGTHVCFFRLCFRALGSRRAALFSRTWCPQSLQCPLVSLAFWAPLGRVGAVVLPTHCNWT